MHTPPMAHLIGLGGRNTQNTENDLLYIDVQEYAHSTYVSPHKARGFLYTQNTEMIYCILWYRNLQTPPVSPPKIQCSVHTQTTEIGLLYIEVQEYAHSTYVSPHKIQLSLHPKTLRLIF